MAEPTIRPIREADVKQIHEIEKACFAMPWSEESILHDVKENVVARWLVLDDGNGGVLAYAGMWFVLDEAHVWRCAARTRSRRTCITPAGCSTWGIASGITRIIKRTR